MKIRKIFDKISKAIDAGESLLRLSLALLKSFAEYCTQRFRGPKNCFATASYG